MRASRSASYRGVERQVSDNTGRYGCGGKRMFPTFGAAEREARSVRRNKNAPMGAYHCRHCQHFHVGFDKPKTNGRPKPVITQGDE